MECIKIPLLDDKKIEDLNQEKYLPLSLIMEDVDGLKIVNDTQGNLKGDEILLQVYP